MFENIKTLDGGIITYKNKTLYTYTNFNLIHGSCGGKTPNEYKLQLENLYPSYKFLGVNGGDWNGIKTDVVFIWEDKIYNRPIKTLVQTSPSKINNSFNQNNIQYLLDIENKNIKFISSNEHHISSASRIDVECEICSTQWNTTTRNIFNRNSGCPKCGGNIKITQDVMMKNLTERCSKLEYNILSIEFTNNKSKIYLFCEKHDNKWWTNYNAFTSQEQACIFCSRKDSKGSRYIQNILEENYILFEKEKKYDKCRNKYKLPFDFFLPEYNILIEYDGEQHYKPISFFGGEEAFTKQKENDNLKNSFCEQNNIKLLRFNEYNISTFVEVINQLRK